MSSYTKPLYEVEKQIEYHRHLSRLDSISNERAKQAPRRDTIGEMHQIRDRSLVYRQRDHIEHINHENEKILTKLLDISQRKIRSTIDIKSPKRMFQNPLRKRQKREIQKSNVSLAERLLAKHSQFDRGSLKRDINEYERTKKMMENNKKKHIELPLLRRLMPEKEYSRGKSRPTESCMSIANPE